MPRLRPQAKGTEGDIISAEGGLLGSGFVSKVGSFLASAEGVSVPEGIEVQIVANHIQLMGRVQQCVFRENGYIIGLKLDSNFQWTQQPGGNFLPAHMLDVALLDLN